MTTRETIKCTFTLEQLPAEIALCEETIARCKEEIKEFRRLGGYTGAIWRKNCIIDDLEYEIRNYKAIIEEESI